MWIRHSISLLGVGALLNACESIPSNAPAAPTAQVAAAPDARASGPGGAGVAQSGAPPGGGAAVPSARAMGDFNRAVGVMRGGNSTEAELEFKQMTLTYPSLSAPFVNLGILYRKNGHLDQSEQALQTAVEHNGASAIAWNELGATQRLRGEFAQAAASYEKAIAADSQYAPAYRNLGVVCDLYLGDPERALTAFERYKELSGEDRPVTSWIAELRQRTGKPPLKPRAAPAPAGAGSDSGNDSGTATVAPSSDVAPNSGAAPNSSATKPSNPSTAPVAPPATSPPKAGD